MRLRFLVVLLLATLCAGACDNTTATTSTPTAPTTTEPPFSGTIGINGAAVFQFSTTARGTVTATLTSLGPDSTMVIGVSLGTWNGASCQIILANDQATQGTTVTGTVSGVGNLCLRVYDSGKLTQPATYTVDVSHP